MLKKLPILFIASMMLLMNPQTKAQQAPQYSNGQLQQKSYTELAEEFKYLFDNSLVPAEKQHRKYLRREMFEYLQTALPNQEQDLGKAMEEARLQTLNKVKQQKSARKAAGIPNVKWTERGPNNVGGRSRGLAYDPNDATYRKVWTGGIAGGIFFNNNIADLNSAWQRVDLPEVISVTAIAFDPSNKQIMYVGTGEHSGGPNIPGGNVWKSIDNGKNWTKLPLNLGTWTKEIVVTNKGTVIAATLTGLRRSTDGGTTFTTMVSGGTNGGNSDVEIAADGVIYAGFERGKVFKSSDDGATWVDITPTGETVNARVEIALAQSTKGDSQVIYAISGDIWFKKSVDGGKTWENLQVPLFDDGTKYGSAQVTYNMTMSVHPQDPNFVWLGGTGIFHTIDGGKKWTQYGYWYIHPDQHNIQFSPLNNGEMILANDGGIHFSTQAGNPKKVVADFKARNKDYNVTQFYSVAQRNIIGDNFIMGGAQDNSIIFTNGDGKSEGKSVITGDGCFVFVDQDNPNVVISSTQNGNWYVQNRTGQSVYTFSSGTSPSFVNPAAFDDVKNILYANNGTRSIARCSNISLSTTPVVKQVIFRTPLPAFVNAIKVAKNTPNTLFVGTGGNGRVYRISDIDKDTANVTLISSPEMTSIGAITVSNIDIGANDNELMVTYANFGTTVNVLSIWYSNDGGATWQSKDETVHGLPNVQIRWTMFNPENYKQVITATRMGVYSTNDITAENPAWELSSDGLALTDCRMLHYRPIDGNIAVATGGRGFYTTDIFAKKIEKGTINVSTLPVTSACADSTFNVSFTTTGTFGANNRYEVVLSGEDGTFKNEFVIGTGTTSPIRVTLPRALLATFVRETALVGGNFVGEAKYKIKVVSSLPAFQSGNTQEFNLKAIQAALYNGYNALCTPTGKAIITAIKSKDARFEWFKTTAGVVTSVPPTTDSSIVVGTGSYFFKVFQNGCSLQSANRTIGTQTGSPYLQSTPVFTPDEIAKSCLGKGLTLKSPFVDTYNFNYRWRKGTVDIVNGTNPDFQATENGTYDVFLDHKTTGCSYYYRPLTIKLKDLPEVTLSAKGVTEVKYGNSTTFGLKFNTFTLLPFEVTLSNSSQTFIVNDTIASITVFPKKTGIFKVSSITNACGTGTSKGEQEIKVIPLILNSTLTAPKANYCANEEVTVNYTIDGNPEKDNIYTVQLSDERGLNFKNLTTVGTGSPLKVVLPKDTKAGNKYRLRVIASNPELLGSSTTDSLNIKPVAVGTIITKDTSIYKYSSTKLSITLVGGDAPWTIQTSDNQTITASTSPQILTLNPLETTTYTLKSVKDNSCGEGFVNGTATITILAPLSAEEEANSIFTVFPNPTELNLTVSLKVPSNKATTLEMVDLQGRSILKTVLKVGQISEVIDMQKLPAGTYLIRAEQDEKQSVKKVVKIK